MKFFTFIGKMFTSHLLLKFLAACVAVVCAVVLFAV